MAKAALTSLRLRDYSDRELLFIIEDLADDEGWAETTDIAVRLGIDNKRANQCVGARFAYMARAKWVERHETQTKWRLMDIGYLLMEGKISNRFRGTLDKLSEGDLVLVQRFLGEQYQAMDPRLGLMIRRESQRGITFGRNGRR